MAYPDRVCRRREGDPGLARLVEGGGVRLADPSAVRGELFLALDVRRGAQAQAQQADVRLVAQIEEAWLERDLPQNIVREELAFFDEAGQRVVNLRRRRYRDLVLSEERGGRPNPQAAAALLLSRFLEEVQRPGAEAKGDDELQTRLLMLDRHLPPHLRPPSAPPRLVEDRQMLEIACRQVGDEASPSLARVREVVRQMAQGQLQASPWQRALREHAPEAIEAPTGSRIRLDWSAADAQAPRGPVLAVRLQEMFGMAATPRVCGGVVPVILHLLGPNFRPVQITDDLASFWKNTYPQVRKDLRARYPKHSWPEDPLRAPAVRGARRRGSP